MAASDKPFNNQRTLDIVFAVSNILMLVSVIWMLAQDYYREYKTEQRVFRDVEVALAQRFPLDALPSEDEAVKAEKAVEDTRPTEAQKEEVKEARKELGRLQPKKENAAVKFQAADSEVVSKSGDRDIALEHAKTAEESAKVTSYYDPLLKRLDEEKSAAKAEQDDIFNSMKIEQMKIERIEAPHTKAIADYKKINDRIDGQIKLALSKQWRWQDGFRSLWFIDGYASPLRIQQIVVEDIPIDYNFKRVPRYDRCTSCHLGIADPRFSRQGLEALTKDDPNEKKLELARKFYDSRVKTLGAGSPEAEQIPNPHDVRPMKLSESRLTPGRITEFAAHPRLDLFVGSNSKHPSDKFGCTSCHSGQGSGTSFNDSSHSPNSMSTQAAWAKERGWEFNHMWDFPMHSTRFIEASCIKCHHEVTDLISSDNRVEAPKLLRGHSLIKENGCFGCHEISGWKSGQRVGPDLRLEPSPPLEELNEMNPHLFNRAKNDTDNRPGNIRKVGPSLNRVHEKVQPDWIAKWLASPSAFRPDTKMPHYYGLSTNMESVLPADQKKFPNTEMASIAHFLTAASKDYLAEAGKVARDAKTVKDEKVRFDDLVNRGRLDEKEQKEFDKLKRNYMLRKVTPIADLVPKDYKANKENGRILFTERGCLACHTHQATESAQGNADKPDTFAPEIKSDAVFGPNLSQIKEKLGDSDDARKWLIQWILNPQLHSPRSRMPVSRLNDDEHLNKLAAADIAAWLLAQPYPRDDNDPWKNIKIDPVSKDDLKDLARVYLTRMLSKKDMDKYLEGKLEGVDWEVAKKDVTADEIRLKDKVNDENELRFYVGKKAVTRLGCFGCHDIPGMESVKSIGVALNDWGKKPADRLAFEDINNFYAKHYHTVDSLVDSNGKPVGLDKEGREPYESFFTNALTGHHRQREGYLNQKIRDPRSYDYNRLRAWDDRARMPKFTLARPRKQAGEADADFKARAMKDEAGAREAVATFVLGLTAEQVPTKSINTPTGDREKEVKGRQVLDKYNCAGCHMIRPGVYDFKIGPDSLKQLDAKHAAAQKAMEEVFQFPNHHNWTGRNPLGTDRLTIYGMPPQWKEEEDEDGLKLRKLLIPNVEAFRFVGGDKSVKSIASSFTTKLPVSDVLAQPDSVKSQADLDRLFANSGPYGGTFAELMTEWLHKRNPQKYPKAGNFAEARASLPPSLIGQGERTQPDWLTGFLLDPQPVRRMSVLRMPKFNMSNEEANALRDYFAAVTRQTNPGIGLVYPTEIVPAKSDPTSDYWRKRTVDYVNHLKKAPERAIDGKLIGKGRTEYEARIAAYTPLWEQIRKQKEPDITASLQQLKDQYKVKMAERDEKEKLAADEKDEKKKKKLDEDFSALKDEVVRLTGEKEQAEKALKNLEIDSQRKQWEMEDAYAADAYRLLTSRDTCVKCHQVGEFTAMQLDKQGPPLHMATVRLRADWTERWINEPQRFLHYQSVMPTYFDKREGKLKWQPMFAGDAAEQMHALRDVLMNYRAISAMPINRMHK